MWRRFMIRFSLALILMFALYNVFGFSYYHWLITDSLSFAMVVPGLVLLAGMLFFLLPTIRAPGKLVFLTIDAVLHASIYWMHGAELIDLANPTGSIVIAQIMTALVLALGSIWSIIWRQQTGQHSVEDPDTSS